ncbi:MAG: efflux RND transporter periplasmic adaptor subunit [Bacteroidetes bacterium]|nr:efflux RND transporter periplasmic adaptor subunit [Bacteroidota bacterium]
MKTINKITFFAVLILLAASCGKSGNQLDKLKSELNDLKTKRQQLNEKIAKLENKISLLDTSAKQNSKAKLVTIKSLEYGNFTNYIEIIGKIDAEQNTVVSPEAAGTLLKIFVQNGQSVTIGQTLGEIDNTVSTVALNELKQQIDFAKTVYEKQKSLWEQKIGTEIQYLTAKNNYESLQKRLATMNQQIGMTRIKSPINGIIDDIYVKTGQTVAPGVPCFRVVNSINLKVKADIAESFSGKVKKGNKVVISFPDINKETTGYINFISSVIDPINRSFKIEIPIETNGEYRPNMMVKIKIIDYSNPNSISVPVGTIRTLGEENFVIIAEKTNDNKYKAILRKVKTGATYNGITEITDGLAAGDKLITIGYQDLENGTEIKF